MSSDDDEADKSANPDPEDNKPDTSENEKGGSDGRDERKINTKRKESAKELETRLRRELAQLTSTQDRYPGISGDIAKLKKQIRHAVLMQQRSETHGRRGKGNR